MDTARRQARRRTTIDRCPGTPDGARDGVRRSRVAPHGATASLLVALLALAGLAPPAPAAEPPAAPPFRINGHVVPPAASPRDRLLADLRDGDWIVARLGTAISAAARRDLRAAGADDLAFLPPDALLLRVVEARALRAHLASARAAAIELLPFDPAHKIDADFLAPAAAAPPDALVGLVAHGAASLGALEDALLALDAPITSRPHAPAPDRVDRPAPPARLGLRVAAADLPDFLRRAAASPAVLALEPAAGVRLLNDNANRIVQSGGTAGGVAGYPIWTKGLHGDGQVIAVLDSGLDYDSCFFAEADGSAPPLINGTATGTPDLARRKVIAYDFLFSGDFPADPASDFDNFGHGTWVAGNALGSSLTAPTAFNVRNGLAPLARLVVQDGGFTTFDDCSDLAALGCPVIDLTPMLEQAWAQGARFHNNSWGDRENFSPQNTYTAVCVDMDDITWRRPEFLIVCAAGNAGPGQNTVGSPSTAKNVLSIAASGTPSAAFQPNRADDPEAMQPFSSRGFASDGRIKPDLAAPGVTATAGSDGNVSTNNCGTTNVGGTSMASPVAAGAAALVREYFEKGWHPSGAPDAADAFEPSAALLKATLIAGAHDMTAVPDAPPNRPEGWGRVHLTRTLAFPDGPRRLLVVDRRAAFDTADDAPVELDLVVEPDAAAGDTRIALVWTDPPAAPLATTALVNDLDLVVEDLATGTTWRGNVLDATTGLSATGGAADGINNVEVAQFAPAPGAPLRLRVRVVPRRIVEEGQGFALAVSGTARLAAPASGVVAF